MLIFICTASFAGKQYFDNCIRYLAAFTEIKAYFH